MRARDERQKLPNGTVETDVMWRWLAVEAKMLCTVDTTLNDNMNDFNGDGDNIKPNRAAASSKTIWCLQTKSVVRTLSHHLDDISVSSEKTVAPRIDKKDETSNYLYDIEANEQWIIAIERNSLFCERKRMQKSESER